MDAQTPAQPGRHWSAKNFAAFWRQPDASRVIGSVTEDIVGYWPRPIGEVRGARPYVSVIDALLRVCPDFRLEVPETASSGDLTFVRWIATGTGPEGPLRINGCDRVRLRGGHVCENFVFCDDPFFQHVARELARPA
jgi:hypothetical protein